MGQRDREVRGRMTTARLTEQVETQAASLKAAWLDLSRLQNRCETLQGMVDWQRARIKELEAQLTPSAIAERVFGGRDDEASSDL